LEPFVEHLVCNPKLKGLKTLFKSNPTPCKNRLSTHNSKRQNRWKDLCLLIQRKKGQKWWNFGGEWVSVERRENGEMGLFGWLTVGGGSGEILTVVSRWWWEGWVAVGFGF
jgi:hypothetical protein